MSEFYHASRPAPSRGDGAAGAPRGASGTRGRLGAMARFHARVGVRLALRILAPSLAILFALYFILRPEFFVYLAGVILGDSGPLARGAFAALTATVAARAAAARVCAGLGGWMRHLPSSAALTRRMAVLAIAVAEAPVIVILAGFAAVSARSASASLPADLAGFAALAPAAAIAAVRTRNRAPRAVLGFAGAALCASGRWLLLAAGLVLAVAAERIAGPVRGPKRKNSVFDGRHALGLPAAIARRAVGKAIAVPYLIGAAVLALAAAFLANNPLPPATAGAAARLGGALALTAFLAAASSLLAARRPPWPLERSWPRSARARVATDALLLSVPAAALLAPLAAVNPGAIPIVAALLPAAGLRAAAAVRLDRELRFGAWGLVLGEGALASAALTFTPWAAAILLAAAVPALELAARAERRQKVSRWLELHHLSAGDPLSWSEG